MVNIFYKNILPCCYIPRFVGEKFFDFYTEEKSPLGEGSFGVVKVCVHRKTKDRRARKRIEVASIKPYNIHVLHSEIQIMKELDHPNVVKLREVFFEPQRVYLVMDLCTGGDLQQYLTMNGPRSETHLSRILRDMIGAVNYLHEQGIVHR
jgi:calcium-dependent protein kinase